ncbi:alpha-2,8-sialyltransferase 8F-like [Pristis pectinata]|uniref:alpha-2,8-sialyltransferase 8F-like n=1 Tax=Pristis pectinata TaxID=685728 RepID=UPI00223DCD11|nr:alpha-2,8-sialyltransferase 8F-like [Pristis pectinata]
MAAMCSFRMLLLSCMVCIFLLGIIHLEYSFDYRYMGQLSKLKLNNMLGPTLQVNDSEEERQNDSDRGDRGCGTCISSQQLNIWSPLEWNSTDCEKIYKWMASSPIQRQMESDIMKRAAQLQHCPWQQQGAAAKEFRRELKRCCHAAYNCLVTQKNTPVGTELTYEAEPKKKIKIHHQIFAIFPKDSSLRSRQYKRCAVIGNSGILTNSSCGAEIDMAEFVFRCNLPPMGGAFAQDIGTKTNLVTANPSIIAERYGELQDRRKPFFTNLTIYNDALLLLPAFSYTKNTILSFRALYTLQDFQAKQEVVFFNPVYLKHLSEFWHSKGIRANRLSTGIMVASVAIELCEEVWIYGFWPFKENVDGQPISHHYFDNQLPKPDIHAMPLEYQQLLQMHSKGIIKLQIGECQVDP